jgi:hypothetical protein
MTSGECFENKWFHMKYIGKYLSAEILLTRECTIRKFNVSVNDSIFKNYCWFLQSLSSAKFQGTYKVRNETETKRNEINENETKRNQQKRNETKRNQRNENEIKRSQRKQNEINENKTK